MHVCAQLNKTFIHNPIMLKFINKNEQLYQTNSEQLKQSQFHQGQQQSIRLYSLRYFRFSMPWQPWAVALIFIYFSKFSLCLYVLCVKITCNLRDSLLSRLFNFPGSIQQINRLLGLRNFIYIRIVVFYIIVFRREKDSRRP